MVLSFDLHTTLTLDLEPRGQWMWYSSVKDGFIIGDTKRAYSVPVSKPNEPELLEASRKFPRDVPIQGAGGVPTIMDFRRKEWHPFNLPIPDSLYEELAQRPWRGLRFLPISAYDNVPEDDPAWLGSLVGALCHVGPDCDLYMLHHATGLILSLNTGNMKLLRQLAEGFTLLDETRTRGRKAMAFATHPAEAFIVYGDNYGDFFAQEFSASGFGKCRKIDSKKYGARSVEFIDEGKTLVVGGIGYLATYSWTGKKFVKAHETSAAVRELTWIEEERILLVNQGTHGVSFHRIDEAGITHCGAVKCDGAMQKAAASKNLEHLALAEQYGEGDQAPRTVTVHLHARSQM